MERCPLIANKTKEEEIQTCLNCPFTQCILELPKEHPTKVRNTQIRELASQGKTQAELASIFNMRLRTVQRALLNPVSVSESVSVSVSEQ